MKDFVATSLFSRSRVRGDEVIIVEPT